MAISHESVHEWWENQLNYSDKLNLANMINDQTILDKAYNELSQEQQDLVLNTYYQQQDYFNPNEEEELGVMSNHSDHGEDKGWTSYPAGTASFESIANEDYKTYQRSMDKALGLKSVDSHYKSDGITCGICGETPSDKREHLRKHYGAYFDEIVASESKAKEDYDYRDMDQGGSSLGSSMSGLDGYGRGKEPYDWFDGQGEFIIDTVKEDLYKAIVDSGDNGIYYNDINSGWVLGDDHGWETVKAKEELEREGKIRKGSRYDKMFEGGQWEPHGHKEPSDYYFAWNVDFNRIGESKANEDGGYANFGSKSKENSWSVLTNASDLWFFETRDEAEDYVRGFPEGSYQINPPQLGESKASEYNPMAFINKQIGLKSKVGEVRIERDEGSIKIDGKDVIKVWETMNGWYHYAVEDKGEYIGVDADGNDVEAHEWFGYTQGDFDEWGYFDSKEFDRNPMVWEVPKSNWAWTGRSDSFESYAKEDSYASPMIEKGQQYTKDLHMGFKRVGAFGEVTILVCELCGWEAGELDKSVDGNSPIYDKLREHIASVHGLVQNNWAESYVRKVKYTGNEGISLADWSKYQDENGWYRVGVSSPTPEIEDIARSMGGNYYGISSDGYGVEEWSFHNYSDAENFAQYVEGKSTSYDYGDGIGVTPEEQHYVEGPYDVSPHIFTSSGQDINIGSGAIGGHPLRNDPFGVGEAIRGKYDSWKKQDIDVRDETLDFAGVNAEIKEEILSTDMTLDEIKDGYPEEFKKLEQAGVWGFGESLSASEQWSDEEWFTEIEKLASGSGVKRIPVENFLMTLDGQTRVQAEMNFENDASVYGWNGETQEAISKGISKYFSKESKANEGNIDSELEEYFENWDSELGGAGGSVICRLDGVEIDVGGIPTMISAKFKLLQYLKHNHPNIGNRLEKKLYTESKAKKQGKEVAEKLAYYFSKGDKPIDWNDNEISNDAERILQETYGITTKKPEVAKEVAHESHSPTQERIIDRKLAGVKSDGIIHELMLWENMSEEQATKAVESTEIPVMDSVSFSLFNKKYSELNEVEQQEIKLYGGEAKKVNKEKDGGIV